MRWLATIFCPWLEIYWLRRDLAETIRRATEIACNPELVFAEYRDGRFDLAVKTGWPAKLMMMAFGDMLKDAPNHVTMTGHDGKDQPLEITIRRCHGKTPADIIGELRDEIAKLKGAAE